MSEKKKVWEDGHWVMHTKGGPNKTTFEIAVVWSEFEHGFRSYGWYGDSKYLITHNGGPCKDPIDGYVWDECVKVAIRFAARMNAAL